MQDEAPVNIEEKIKLDLRTLAKPGCRKCFGRGFASTDAKTGRINICRCARIALTKIAAQIKKDKAAAEHAKECGCNNSECVTPPVTSIDTEKEAPVPTTVAP